MDASAIWLEYYGFFNTHPEKGYRCVDLSNPIHAIADPWGQPTMMFYILIIAVLNIGLGFVAAAHLGRRYNRPAVLLSHSETVSVQQQAAAWEDSDEEPNDVATEEPPDTDSEDSSEKTPDEPEADEFAGDLDALFDEIES